MFALGLQPDAHLKEERAAHTRLDGLRDDSEHLQLCSRSNVFFHPCTEGKAQLELQDEKAIIKRGLHFVSLSGCQS